jgi:uncharacterized protein YkwD
MLMLLNGLRGEHPLTLAPELSARAQTRAQYFCDHPLSHDGWEIYFEGTPYTVMGENLAKGYSDAKTVVDAWMKSPGHRANILNPDYKQFGVGQACGVFVQFFSG